MESPARYLRLRAAESADRSELAELICVSTNYWYQIHGSPQIFPGGPETTEAFVDVYSALDPGCTVVAENTRTGRLMGSCFYHPRPHHVSLGIMNVHPNYFGAGVARALLDFIIDYTDRHHYNALRLTQSALNLDSFSLYNRAGFVPRCAYQDMMVAVPGGGITDRLAGEDNVRDATAEDVPRMAAVEKAVSGITRERDYEYCIANELGIWHASVYENAGGEIEGFLISCSHPATNILGPCVARSEEAALALIRRETDFHRGRPPIAIVPMDKTKIVRRLYDWGARNCELHFCQVRGEFQPFNGVNMPTILPESG